MSDPFVDVTLQQWTMNRERTLATLDAIAALPDPPRCLGWRPGPGRAHIAWQLLHVGITEELFATERLRGTTPGHSDLVPRFRGGSTPDDHIPSVESIREVLAATREHLLATARTITTAELETVPDALSQRNLTVRQAFRILTWHEAHHQGQAHITLNLFKAAHT